MSGADIRAVLYAMVDVMQDALANGQIVRLGEPGSLRVGISSERKAAAEEVNSTAILSFRWFNFQIAQFTIFISVFQCVPQFLSVYQYCNLFVCLFCFNFIFEIDDNFVPTIF